MPAPEIIVQVQPSVRVDKVISDSKLVKVSAAISQGTSVPDNVSDILEPVDGINKIFETAFPFASLFISVYLNGLKLNPADYQIIPPNKIELLEAPLTGDILEINYIK